MVKYGDKEYIYHLCEVMMIQTPIPENLKYQTCFIKKKKTAKFEKKHRLKEKQQHGVEHTHQLPLTHLKG